jgi:hypothetical protein
MMIVMIVMIMYSIEARAELRERASEHSAQVGGDMAAMLTGGFHQKRGWFVVIIPVPLDPTECLSRLWWLVKANTRSLDAIDVRI